MEGKVTAPPIFVALDAYVKKGVGIDMVMKSLLGVSRLMAMYTSNPEMSQHYAEFAHKIVNCRMLANHFRHFMSFTTALRILEKKDGPFLTWFSLFLSFLFRSLEQVFGDLNYYQMIMMHHWSRRRLTLGYHFFKSLSLTSGLINELSQWGRIAAMPNEKRSAAVTASIISIVRYLCDMTVYYQWMPFYNPPKAAQYFFGSLAGMLGVYVGWTETTKSLTTELPQKKPLIEEKAIKAPVEEKPIKAPVEEKAIKAPVEEKPIKAPVEEKPIKAPVEEKAKDHLGDEKKIEPTNALAKPNAEENGSVVTKPVASVAAKSNIQKNEEVIAEAGDLACAHSGEHKNAHSVSRTNERPQAAAGARANGSAKTRAYGKSENGRRSAERNAPAVGADMTSATVA